MQIVNGGYTGGSLNKFHLNGLIYAPSAALDFTANDNDASWTTDGIVSRQLSALKWANNGDTPAVGGDPSPRNPRKVTIYVCKKGSNCSAGNIQSKVYVWFVDYDDGSISVGHTVDIVSWLRNQ
jgi:hypothetical protein